MTNRVPLIINGEEVQSSSDSFVDVLNPATQELVCQVPLATASELEDALKSASAAFPAWRDTPVQQRARVMLKLQALIREHSDEIAKCISIEQGKTFADAKGDVFRGLEVVEFSCSMPTLMMGEMLPQLSRHLDTEAFRVPLGVCSGICPFNFPAMIPLWMVPVAVAAGNTFILKPSERDPGACMILGRLFKEAGLPNGVLNIVHGTADCVKFLCTAPSIKAVSFVGSSKVGKIVYDLASTHGKRVQCNVGAKNHCVIMPDADPQASTSAVVGAAFGAAGQRCMAISVCVVVGDADQFIPLIKAKAQALKVTAGLEEGADIGPVISPEAKARIVAMVEKAKKDGAEVLLDGTNITVEEYPRGNFVGPTMLTAVDPSMEIYQEEVFGPVLIVMKVATLKEAIQLINENQYGNGTALFTRSGEAARQFKYEIEVGQVGINVPVPVPLPFFAWTGSKSSFLGDVNFYGKSGVRFYTQIRTVVSLWKPSGGEGDHAVSTSMPVLKH